MARKSTKSSGSSKPSKRKTAAAKKNKSINICVQGIKLSKECRKALRKVKHCVYSNVANAIECGDWFIPVRNYKYSHIKKRLEDAMKDFYSLKDDVVIDDFQTNIIEYDNHR